MVDRIPALTNNLYNNNFWLRNYYAVSGTGTTTLDLIQGIQPQQYQQGQQLNLMQQLSGFSVANFQAQQIQYRQQISDFSTAVKGLATAAKGFAAGNSLFDQKYVSSASVAIAGEAKTGAKTAVYDVNVSQMATTQRNTSTTLASSAFGALIPGGYRFGVTIGGQEREITLNVLSTDNNKQVLAKLGNAVNNAGIGVQADVRTTGANSYLNLESRATGAAQGFTLRDISGNAITGLNLGNRVQTAANAQGTVNGTAFNQTTNRLTLDGGNVTLNLLGRPEGTVQVSVAADAGRTVEGVRNFATAFNQLNDVLTADNSTDRGLRLLGGVRSALLGNRADAYAAIGVTLDVSNGGIAVNEGILTQAIGNSPNEVRSLMTSLAGMAGTAAKAATENAPFNYISPPGLLNNVDLQLQQLSGLMPLAAAGSPLQGLFVNLLA